MLDKICFPASHIVTLSRLSGFVRFFVRHVGNSISVRGASSFFVDESLSMFLVLDRKEYSLPVCAKWESKLGHHVSYSKRSNSIPSSHHKSHSPRCYPQNCSKNVSSSWSHPFHKSHRDVSINILPAFA